MAENDGDTAVPALGIVTAAPSWLLRYRRSYPGRCDQVRHVRAFLRDALADCPRADDAIAVASELAANACLHSMSGAPGGVFTVRAEVSEDDHLYIAVEDQGGAWDVRSCELLPQHGLELVQAMVGPGNWGIAGDAAGRLVWARLTWPADDRLDRALTTPHQQEGNTAMTPPDEPASPATIARGRVAALLAGSPLHVQELANELVITNPLDPERGKVHVAHADGYVSLERVTWQHWGHLEGYPDEYHETGQAIGADKIIATLADPPADPA